MTSLTILISGAGIAGSCVAYWLRRHGHAVTMIERAPAPRQGGQTVDLRGAGRTVIDRMGLLPQVRQGTVSQRGLAWIDEAGGHRAEMPVEAFGGRGIISADEILRGDLAGILFEASRAGVEQIFDDTITALADGPDGVDVAFETAANRRFDLVVGADGLHSVVRRLTFGPESQHVRPLGLLTAWFTVPAEVDLANWYLMHNAIGGKVASLRPGRLPTEQKAGLSIRTRETFDRRDVAAQQALLARHFADVGWEARRLVRAAASATDFYLESIGQVRMARWSRGRVVLVGDAGYCPTPLTGLGTSLALVGSYVLAGELATGLATGLDPAAALAAGFAAYEARLRPYVTQAQQLPPGGVAGYAPRTRFAIAAMRWSMRSAQRWPQRPLMDKIFSKADAIELPEYALVG